jgi:hypothetical protein
MKTLILSTFLTFVMSGFIFSQEVDVEEEVSALDVVVLKKDSLPDQVKQDVLKEF